MSRWRLRAKTGRVLAEVVLADGTNVNHELVKDGWFWWYRNYAPSDTILEGWETAAREAKRGLWDDPSPIPPWEWRNAKRASEHSCYHPTPTV